MYIAGFLARKKKNKTCVITLQPAEKLGCDFLVGLRNTMFVFGDTEKRT